MNLKKSYLKYCEDKDLEINENQIKIVQKLNEYYNLNFKQSFLNNLEIVTQDELKKETSAEQTKTLPKFPDRKMKRNEPCFCKSGKKFKHCHGAL